MGWNGMSGMGGEGGPRIESVTCDGPIFQDAPIYDHENLLARTLKVHREGSFTRNALEEPTDDDINRLVDWFFHRQDIDWLKTFLESQKWDGLDDMWKMRAALEVAQEIRIREVL